jgi:hypothetical protein
MVPRTARPFLGLASFLAISASQLGAQSVELRVRGDSAAPIVGAIVRLLGERGVVARGLTDGVGRVVLRARDAGSYRIRIDRIGWSGLTTTPLTLGAGQTLRVTVPMPSHRVQLPTIEVRAHTRCDAGGPRGELAAALWDEVQKALTANLITESGRQVPVHLRAFVRELDLDGRSLRQWTVVSMVTRGSPFATVSSAALLSRGFMYQEGDSAVFAAPDAALLLSDEFVSTHCFFARTGTGELTGLAFQPVRDRRVPDVSGTLWVDRETSELRYLEYAYTGLPPVLRRRELGGRLEFTQLPGGEWIVGYWHVRMPQAEARTIENNGFTRVTAKVVGFTDRGGRAEVVGDTSGLVHRAILSGRVYDSIAGKGLAGAMVWVQGTPDTMPTDNDGRFSMALAAAGDHVVLARHPRLGLLGEPTRRPVLLSIGDTTVVEFGVPPVAAFLRALCRNRNQPGRVSIVGTAWMHDGSPAAGQEIRAMKAKPGGNVDIPGVRPTRSSATGLYGICNLPGRDTVQLIMGSQNVTYVELPVPVLNESRWLDLRGWSSSDSSRVGFISLLARAQPEQEAPDSGERSFVAGSVYDSTTGSALPGATVRVHGQSDSAITDADGRFTLKSAAGGQLLTVTHGSRELRGVATKSAVLVPRDTSVVSFSVIPVNALFDKLCPGARDRPGVIGIAHGASGGPEEGLILRVQWFVKRKYELHGRSGPGGLYAFCDLPAELTGGNKLTVQVIGSGGLMGEESFDLMRKEPRWVDLRLPKQ